MQFASGLDQTDANVKLRTSYADGAKVRTVILDHLKRNGLFSAQSFQIETESEKSWRTAAQRCVSEE